MQACCGEKRRLGLRLIPVRTVRLGRQGQESRSQGPGCCPMRGLIPPTPSYPALWDRVVGRSGDSVEPGGAPFPGATASPNSHPSKLQKWAAALPGLTLQLFWLTPGPTAPGGSVSGTSEGEDRRFSSRPISAFCFDKMRKIRTWQ